MPTKSKSKVDSKGWPDKRFIGIRLTVGGLKKIRPHLTGQYTFFDTHTWEKREDRGLWEEWICPVCRLVKVCDLKEDIVTFHFGDVKDSLRGTVTEVQCA